MSGTREHLEIRPTSAEQLFYDQQFDQWGSFGNEVHGRDMFRKAKKYIRTGDHDASIQSLTEIINSPHLTQPQYVQACYFLNKLVAFTEAYFDLYGVPFENGN